MSYYIEIPLSDGANILAEITSQTDETVPVGRGREIVGRLPEALTEGLDRVQDFVGEILDRMKSYYEPPDRISVEFGLKFSAKVGVVVAESVGEGHLTVTAEWSKPSTRGENTGEKRT